VQYFRISIILAIIALSSCSNPFSPPLGDPVSIWTDQTTVGGLLENFRLSYNRHDSLRYAECIACPGYAFNYFDTDLGEYAWMPRELDLQTTGRLFSHYDEIDLRWFGIGDEVANISAMDSSLALTVFFELMLNTEIVTGHARFQIRKELPLLECESPIFGQKPVFRIQEWDDDL
jgi:hypothetical protein